MVASEREVYPWYYAVPLLIFAASLFWGIAVAAQEQSVASPDSPTTQTKKEARKQKKKLGRETGNARLGWLEEDAVYIITKEEREAFKRLTTNEERDQFIEIFWDRRNPNPESDKNTFKEEHYLPIAYANDHFAFPDGRRTGNISTFCGDRRFSDSKEFPREGTSGFGAKSSPARF